MNLDHYKCAMPGCNKIKYSCFMCEKTDGRSHEYKVYQEISDDQDKKNGISRKKTLQ